MRRFVRWLPFVFVIILAVLYLQLLVTAHRENIPEARTVPEHHIQVLSREVTSYFDRLFEQGALAAAEEYGVLVEFVSDPFGELSMPDAVAVAARAGVDGVAVQSSETDIQNDVVAEVEGYAIELLFYESSDTAALPALAVKSDSYHAGRLSVELALEAGEEYCKALLLIDDVDKERSAISTEQGLQGVVDAFSDSDGGELVDCLYFGGGPTGGTQMMESLLAYEQEYNTVICLHEVYTSFIAWQMDECGLADLVQVIGYGGQPRTLDYIEQGVLYGAVCPDAYAIGYETVAMLSRRLEGRGAPEPVTMQPYVITGENLEQVRDMLDWS